MENGNELIVDLAIKMVIFHSKLLVYQAGYPPVINVASWEIFTIGGLQLGTSFFLGIVNGIFENQNSIRQMMINLSLEMIVYIRLIRSY